MIRIRFRIAKILLPGYTILILVFFWFFLFFFISEVYPGPIYRFCIKNRSSGQPSITFVSNFIITYIMMGNDMR